MGAPQLVEFEWKGQTVKTPLSFDLYMQIEERVSFGHISNCLAKLNDGRADFPLSHIAYIVYCCLRNSGIKIDEGPSQVFADIMAAKIEWGPLLMTLINGFYGATSKAATPEKIEKKPMRSGSSRSNTRR